MPTVLERIDAVTRTLEALVTSEGLNDAAKLHVAAALIALNSAWLATARPASATNENQDSGPPNKTRPQGT